MGTIVLKDIVAGRAAGIVPSTVSPVFTQADIRRIQGTGTTPPSVLIDQGTRAENLINTFDVRSNHVFTFNLGISVYKRDTLARIGNLDLKTFMALPLPNEIVDSMGVRYDTNELGTLIGRAGGGANPFPGAVSSGPEGIPGSLSSALKSIGELGGPFVQGMTTVAGAIAGAAAGVASQFPIIRQGATAILAAFGIAPNPFMIVVFKQPEYKIHQFTWNLTARTPEESFKIAAMIAFLKNAMSPGVDFTQSFFTYPDIFSLSFGYTGKKTYGAGVDLVKSMFYRFKPAVLTDLQTNYTPNGLPAVYAQTQAPQSVSISMKFMEIEYWLKGQFNEDINRLHALGGRLKPTAVGAPHFGFNPRAGSIPETASPPLSNTPNPNSSEGQ